MKYHHLSNLEKNATIHIVDNLYENPEDLRREAIRCTYFNVGTFPGRRSNHHSLNMAHTFESIVGEKIPPEMHHCCHGSFQLILEDDVDSWVHRDPENRWAGVLHLSKNYPEGHGTVFYKEEPDGKMKKTIFVEGVFNRLILYRTNILHRSGVHGFGNNVENGRLTQVWFFHTEFGNL